MDDFFTGMYCGGATGIAILRRDGFVSMNGNGTLLTRKLEFTGKKTMGINAIGKVKAEILDEVSSDIIQNNETIEDLGIHNQKRDKDIHLFKVKLPINIEELHCDSTFIDFRDGTKKPEMDGFELLEDQSKFLFSIQPIVQLGIKS